jgi:hypothetical protein
MLDELVLDLGSEGNVNPIRLMLARRAAANVDNMLFNTDFRSNAWTR